MVLAYPTSLPDTSHKPAKHCVRNTVTRIPETWSPKPPWDILPEIGTAFQSASRTKTHAPYTYCMHPRISLTFTALGRRNIVQPQVTLPTLRRIKHHLSFRTNLNGRNPVEWTHRPVAIFCECASDSSRAYMTLHDISVEELPRCRSILIHESPKSRGGST